MVSPENANWLFECGFIDDLSIPSRDFQVPVTGGFSWPVQGSNASVEVDGSVSDFDSLKENSSKKRARPEAPGPSSTKACRKKLRRDRLNDKFTELGSILENGKPPKTDKAAIRIDAVCIVTQLLGEAQKLKDTNSSLQEKIKELKAKKNELRDGKHRLKAEKERLEQQLKATNTQSFLPPPPTKKILYKQIGALLWLTCQPILK